MKETLPNSEELTPEEQNLKNIFLLSFFYSQGDIDLQKNYFDWMLTTNTITNHQIGGENPPAYILDISPPPRHAHTSKRSQRETLTTVWEYIQELNEIERKPTDLAELQKSILQQMISVETNYLTKNPRPRRKQHKETPYDSFNDRRASFFRKYVLMGHSSGHSNFDSLFESLRYTMQNLPEDEKRVFEKKLQRLGNLWENYHPNESFYIFKNDGYPNLFKR